MTKTWGKHGENAGIHGKNDDSTSEMRISLGKIDGLGKNMVV